MKPTRTFPVASNITLILNDLGVEPVDALRRARLPTDLLQRQPVRLSTSDLLRLWTAVEQLVETSAFALAISESVTGDTFAPCLFASMCSPDMAAALERLRIYKRLVAPMAIDVQPEGDRVRVECIWLEAEVPPPASLIATELAYLVRLARLGTRARIEPLAVESQQPLRPAETYTQWFGVAPQVSTINALTFRAEDLARPFLTANPQLWAVFEGDLRRRLHELDRTTPLVERTRAALLEALPSGRGTLELVAEALGTSGRTLQRRLRSEGRSFRQILLETRQSLAQHYLTTTRIAASEVGFLLGFDDPSSFFRAYHAWTGTTPESTRRFALAS